MTPEANTDLVTFGNGVDLRIAKSTPTTTVTLQGGALVFDDEFSGGAAAEDDETLVLERGVLVAGDTGMPNDVYIRLDHSNTVDASATSDQGQGFVFVPTGDQFPESNVDWQRPQADHLYPERYLDGSPQPRSCRLPCRCQPGRGWRHG